MHSPGFQLRVTLLKVVESLYSKTLNRSQSPTLLGSSLGLDLIVTSLDVLIPNPARP